MSARTLTPREAATLALVLRAAGAEWRRFESGALGIVPACPAGPEPTHPTASSRQDCQQPAPAPSTVGAVSFFGGAQ